MVPETRPISFCGRTTARKSEPSTENTTMMTTARAMERGMSRPGLRVSREWKPAISMPVNSRMIPPRKARFDN